VHIVPSVQLAVVPPRAMQHESNLVQFAQPAPLEPPPPPVPVLPPAPPVPLVIWQGGMVPRQSMYAVQSAMLRQAW